MNVLIWAHCALDNYIFHVMKFAALTPFILLTSCKLSLPSVNLKISSVHNLALKFPNRICMCVIWYLIDYLLYCLTETIFCVTIFNTSQGSIFRAIIIHQQPLNRGTLFYLTNIVSLIELGSCSSLLMLRLSETGCHVFIHHLQFQLESHWTITNFCVMHADLFIYLFIYLKYIPLILIGINLRI